MESARWVVGALYALLGIFWILAGVAGTGNYVYLGIGIVWLLGSACWPLGILRHRRRHQPDASKD